MWHHSAVVKHQNAVALDHYPVDNLSRENRFMRLPVSAASVMTVVRPREESLNQTPGAPN